ncbi:MAG: efflux RND transporter permease subunit, partial [Deltaproteobacteria bacterium]|nr:efflux RND transporter permease subunit [Deltaproteobacteria bacterium]
MISKIIDLSIQNRFLVLLATVLVACFGIVAMMQTPLDAVPDLSDVQVIVYTEYQGQAPQVVEDQITYPLTTAMLGVPGAKTVRGYSFFGLSFVYIIFEDKTDIYWARSRVLESLNFVSGKLPGGVNPTLGPDATGVGWVFEYALVDKTGQLDLSELRSLQDWYLRYELQTVEGVSEVASIGGYVKQYQVEVDPTKLLAFNIPLSKVKHAIMRSNNEVGGRLVEMAETEFMVRGLGYIKGLEDIKNISIGTTSRGVPITIRDIANVQIGPELRRGLSELDGLGEVAGGIVIMRYGENALSTIRGVKEKLEILKKGLPEGVEIIPVYDRSGLIERAIDTLKIKLIEESLVVALICILFLLHLRSALVAILTLPIAILISFIIMQKQGINANIMSLGGIAIAIGAMIDAAIVMIENAHKHIEEDDTTDRWELIARSAKEVGPSLFFSLLIITFSFLPVFTLQAEEGRLFGPLAFTKTYAMGASAFLAITLVPVLMGYMVRGKIRGEMENPINRFISRLYSPVLALTLNYKKLTIIIALSFLVLTIYPLKKLGSEFMPPLNEGDILYMPTTLPGISITKAKELLQQTDKMIMTFPEVERVFGKVGRAETATDPAPLSMIETIITLKPKAQWRRGMTIEKLIGEMDNVVKIPGVTNAWTMPIKTRIDMLSTGIKTPVGIKIAGDDLNVLQELGIEIESVIRDIPGTLSVYSERVVGGNYIDFEIDRLRAARYGLTVGDVQDVISSAIGGMNITHTIEGRERYPVNLRYGRELRDGISKLKRILIPTPNGIQIPIAQVAEIKIKKGPPAIKSENARLNAWIYIDLRDTDIGTYVAKAKKILNKKITLPAGYSLAWSGQYEYMERAKERLKLVIPLTLAIIFLLLFLNFKNITESLIVMLSLPFSAVGGVWLIYLLDYNLSVATGVGFIALTGVAAEIGIIMIVYLDIAHKKREKDGTLTSVKALSLAIYDGASRRIRPIMMTVTAIIGGLLPIMWGSGTGNEIMKRIAAPMVGGMISATILTVIVIPVIYALWKGANLREE